MVVTIPRLIRKFVGLFEGQHDLIQAEATRRHLSFGVVTREMLELGAGAYKLVHDLPAVYPNNKIDFNIKKKKHAKTR